MIGTTKSVSYFPLSFHASLTISRIKEQLRSGELAMSGDVWPAFVYQGYKANEDDIWDGLFRSALLVTVRLHILLPVRVAC